MPTPPLTTDSSPYDAIVVGGGLSGLTCAFRLRQRGLRVLVVEADAQVGGRLQSGTLQGATVDHGGQWFGPGHRHVADLIDELGLATETAIVPGAAVALRDGVVRRLDQDDASQSPASPARRRLEELASAIPENEPWTADDAETLDGMTVADWLRRGSFDPRERRELELQLNVVWGRPPHAISLLYGLWFIRGAGGFQEMTDSITSRIVGGANALPSAVAERLQGSVLLESPVTAVTRRHDGFAVHAAHGEHVAQRVVVVMSPADARNIDFQPCLPTLHHLLRQNWQQVPALKFHVAYPRPFWREMGLSGTASADLGVFPWCTDDSPRDGSIGVLVGLMNLHGPQLPLGSDPQALDDPAHRRRLVLGLLTRLFGEEAATPSAYEEHSWLGRPFVSGVVGPTSPGLLTAYGPGLHAPVDGLHWAGSDISPIWNGWMSGAVAAGERAAREVAGHTDRGGEG